MKLPHPLVLIILDGWGHREASADNAIAAAHKPNWEELLKRYPHTLISGSGRCVGLPQDQMGNSEVGHLNMGAGRIVQQDLTRIDDAIAAQEFFKNDTFSKVFENAEASQKAVHVMGLLSPGGVHSHENHVFALIKLAARFKIPALYVHAFLDGRDTPPRSALPSLQLLHQCLQQTAHGKIATLIGRYYAMDRDQRWERIRKAYNLIMQGHAQYQAANAELALQNAYARDESDEFVSATTIADYPGIQEGDAVIFMNFRADRARELTESFTAEFFQGFTRNYRARLSYFVCLSEYDKRLQLPVAFPSQPLKNIFADYISQQGLTQLRIAETEKYAHVTFFFNGGIEIPFPHEERILIPSPHVKTYNLQPEMSAPELTQRLIAEIKNQHHAVIICNFANADMVGHTGNFAATVRAIETIDQCLGKIVKTITTIGGELLITADHGNAELMYDPQTQQCHTAHTSELVPFIYVGRPAFIKPITGKLSDISPTMLYLLNLPKPAEMTGQTLIELL